MGLASNAEGIGGAVEKMPSMLDSIKEAREELINETTTGDDEGGHAEEARDPSEASESQESAKVERTGAGTKADGSALDAREGGPRKVGRPKKEKPVEETDDGKVFTPPSSFNLKEKEDFHALPRQAKEAVVRLEENFQKFRLSEVHKERSKTQQERDQLNAERQYFQSMTETVKPWLNKWDQTGTPPEAAITKLLTFNDEYIKDPARTIESMAKASGLQITIHNRPHSNSQNNHRLTTREENPRDIVRQELEARDRQRYAQSISQDVDGALNSLLNEMNAEGKYIHPDLHSLQFQAELEPLVLSIKSKNPSLPWKDVLLRAYKANDGRVLPNTIAPKLNNSRTNVAQKAMLSRTGRSGGSESAEYKAEPNESFLQTLKRTREQLMNR